MASKKPRPASTENAAPKTRSLKDGTIVGRASDRLLELDRQERQELARRSPEAIKASFKEKREDVLSKLTETQRAGAEAMAKAMSPSEDKAAAE